jgi:hypothetical protein
MDRLDAVWIISTHWIPNYLELCVLRFIKN